MPALAVGHDASQTTRPSNAFISTFTFGLPPSFQSRVVVVGQDERAASAEIAPPAWFGPPFDPSVARGVFQLTNEEQSLSDVRRPEARTAKIDRCEGVCRSFHVRLNNVEPSKSVLARNLFAKDSARLSDGDEFGPHGPKMASVGEAFAFAGRAERLARTRAGPDFAIVRPSSHAESKGPDSDARKEMALPVSA